MIRKIIGLAILALVVVGLVVAWSAGWVQQVWAWIVGVKNSIVAFIDQPWGFEQLSAVGGMVLGPILILVIIFAIVEQR